MAAVSCTTTGVTFLIINQVRANIGYGADTTTGGGWALRHTSTTKCKFRRTSRSPLTVGTGDNKVEVGHEVSVLVERSRVSVPRRKADFVLLRVGTDKFGPIGIDRADEACTLGINHGIIQQSGAWYTLPLTGERLQGREAALSALRSSPEIIEHIRSELLKISASAVVPETDGDDEETAAADEVPEFRMAMDDDE